MINELKVGDVVAVNFNNWWEAICERKMILTKYGEEITIAIWRIKKLKP